MRSRAEVLLKSLAGVAALSAFGALGLSLTGRPTGVWPGLGLLYVTGVSFGLGEMTRLFRRHKRRCRECLQGARPHVRWWAPRLVIVLLASLLPVLLLLPMAASRP